VAAQFCQYLQMSICEAILFIDYISEPHSLETPVIKDKMVEKHLNEQQNSI